MDGCKNARGDARGDARGLFHGFHALIDGYEIDGKHYLRMTWKAEVRFKGSGLAFVGGSLGDCKRRMSVSISCGPPCYPTVATSG